MSNLSRTFIDGCPFGEEVETTFHHSFHNRSALIWSKLHFAPLDRALMTVRSLDGIATHVQKYPYTISCPRRHPEQIKMIRLAAYQIALNRLLANNTFRRHIFIDRRSRKRWGRADQHIHHSISSNGLPSNLLNLSATNKCFYESIEPSL